MGLKARVAEHNAGLAELLQEEHREKEGVVSSGHEQMDNLSAVAYVLDEPDIGSITAATGHDVDFEAVSAKLEARLAANATPPSEQEEALVPAPPVEAPPPSPPLPEATPQPLEAEESSEEITSGEGKPPQAPRVVGPPPSGKLGPKDVVMLEVRGSCENSDGSLLSRQVLLLLPFFNYNPFILKIRVCLNPLQYN